MVGYIHVNSVGTAYYLNKKKVILANGGKVTIYFFTKDARSTFADLPSDRTVVESERSHTLFIKKK